MVLILSLVCIDYLELTISSLKQLILDQTRQSRVEWYPFCFSRAELSGTHFVSSVVVFAPRFQKAKAI